MKSAIIFNTIASSLLLIGAGFLVSSLVYSNYVETNETDYDQYKTGKNLSRGFFYSSMGCLGTGTLCLAVSIPLFIK